MTIAAMNAPSPSPSPTPIYDALVERLHTVSESAPAAGSAAATMRYGRGVGEESPGIVVVPASGVRLSEDALWVARLAEREAGDLGHRRIGAEHLLLALLQSGGQVTGWLRGAGIELGTLRRRVTAVDTGAGIGPGTGSATSAVAQVAPTWSMAAAAVRGRSSSCCAARPG